ncbi:chloroplast-targeted copper chaperone protein [Genlisea aurea]|uniref:Chloroplast-targeted copper chaperone protein n=1 Tax=Genlisea aurea TaxID=192259 RepID=S8C6M9_9LAMI|nr:chloroplast-targeted copper chaperone protein [Genlisea aurea]
MKEIDAINISAAAVLSRSPAIDRCNPILRDSNRTVRSQMPHGERNDEFPNRNRDEEKISSRSDETIPVKSNSSPVFALWNRRKLGNCSARYLLGEEIESEFTDSGSAPKVFDESPKRKNDEEVVVVLRVSLLCKCKGCEKKMKKHISKIQGVAYFDIDFAMKKVTVAGNVKPSEVLSSISKVKNAQLWPQTAEEEFDVSL